MTYRPVIVTQADLEAAWKHLIGGFGPHRRSVWWIFLERDGRPLPQLAELEEAGGPPDAEQVAAFGGFLADLAGSLELDGPRVAFLISRPGYDAAQPADRAWATSLYEVARVAGLPCEVVHLANDAGIVPLPWDALAAS